MGILRRIERRLEGIFAGGFGRTFHSHVQPIELARKLAKEMDDHRRISVQRVYVPNVYRVFLSRTDREQFATYEASLRAELAGYLAEHARREGYAMVTRPKVFLETAEELDAGTFGIAVSIEEPSNPPGSAGRAPAAGGLPPEFADGSAPLPPGVRAPAGPPPVPPVIPQALREPAVPPSAVPDAPAPVPEVPAVPADAPAAAEAAEAPVEPPVEAPAVEAPAVEAPAVEAPEAPVAAEVAEPAVPVDALAVAAGAGAAAAAAAVPAAPEPPVAPPVAPPPPPVPEPATPAGVPPSIERYELVWAGGRIAIERRALVLGRSRECDVVITDGNVSRRHAELVRDAEGFLVRDLDSTNGVLVNGRRVRESRVGPGDAIVVGLTTLRLERTRM